MSILIIFFFFFSSRRRHTRWNCDWSSDVCSSDLWDARSHLKAAKQRGSGAGADEQALFACQPFYEAIRLFGGNMQILIGDRVIVNRGTYRRRHVLPTLESVEGRIRLQAD